MAKTIRSHPTSHILVSEPICWTTPIFSNFGPKKDIRFLHFPTSLQVKRPRPKGKKMRMDHPFILGFCQSLTFYIVFTICVSFVSEKTTFFNYCHILIILCISDSKMGDPRLLLFQHRTLISKSEPCPKGIFHQIWDPSIALSCAILCYFALFESIWLYLTLFCSNS